MNLSTTATETVSKFLFSWIDYSFFSVMLLISLLIGLYFGCVGKGQNTPKDYLLGGKKMNAITVAFSLVASHISAIAILGIPSEIYLYGTTYAMSTVSSFIICFLIAYIYLPVFYNLKIHNSFMYLELRFNRSIRKMASIISMIGYLTYIPIVVYLPALVFSQVSDFNLHTITIVLCVICIFYTMIGGFKTVVWTDTIQCIVMLFSMGTILCIGLYTGDGLAEIWSKADKGERLDFFNMDPSLTVRNTFWGATIGLTFLWMAQLGINQGSIQKMSSVATISEARKAIYLVCFCLALIKIVSCITGLIIYAKYFECDPLITGRIKKGDQLLPYYVMDIARNIYGLPGLFMAGIFSAALSTMSAGMNTMSGVLYEDFIVPYMPADTTEARASCVMKGLVVIIGAVCVGLVFIVESLGTVLQLSISFGGITGGPMLGIFTLGILYPWANSKGTLVGAISAMGFLSFIVAGAQTYVASGTIKSSFLPLSAENCSYEFNITKPMNTTLQNDQELFYLFRISHMHYSYIGFFITLFVGMLVSWLTGGQDFTDFNRDFISPCFQKFLPDYVKSKTYTHDYKLVQIDNENNIKKNIA